MWTYVVIFTFRAVIAGKRASGALGGSHSHSGRLEEERKFFPWRKRGLRDSSALQCVAHSLCRRGKIVTVGLRNASDDIASYPRKVYA